MRPFDSAGPRDVGGQHAAMASVGRTEPRDCDEEGGDDDGICYLVAAHVVGASDHCGAAFYRARSPEVFRVSKRRLGAGPAARCSRRTRTRRRNPPADRLLYPNCRLHPVRRHGRGLFHGARAEKLLSAGQWGSAGYSVLLCILLYLRRRRRTVEPRPAASVVAFPVIG